MASGDLITADYMCHYGGELLSGGGVAIGQGTNGVEIVRIDPWSNAPIRSSDINRPLADGQFPGEDYNAGRFIVIDFELWGSTDAELADNWEKVLQFTRRRRDERDLVFRIPGWDDDFYCLARPRARTGLVYDTPTIVGRRATGSVQFYATDPRLYGNTLQLQQGGLAVASGGLTFNATANFVFGSSGSSGILDCTNEGIYPSFANFVITGPVTNPSIENQSLSTIKTLEFIGTVNTGETLEINSQDRTVLLNGTASRYSWLDDPTQWFRLQNGSNDIVFRGTSAGSPTLDVEWRDAWA
jgi:hypothetical protein